MKPCLVHADSHDSHMKAAFLSHSPEAAQSSQLAGVGAALLTASINAMIRARRPSFGHEKERIYPEEWLRG